MPCTCTLTRGPFYETVVMENGQKKRIHKIEHVKCQDCKNYEKKRNKLIPSAESHANKKVHGGKNNPEYGDLWSAAFSAKMDELWRDAR